MKGPESGSPEVRKSRRTSAWWVIGGGIGAAVLMLTGLVLWWKLPVWKPEWVIKYSPFIEPALRAELVSDHYYLELSQELRERFEKDWGANATPALLHFYNNQEASIRRNSDVREYALQLLAQYGDERAFDVMNAALATSFCESAILSYFTRFRSVRSLTVIRAFCARRIRELTSSGKKHAGEPLKCDWSLLSAYEALDSYSDPDALPECLQAISLGFLGRANDHTELIASLATHASPQQLSAALLSKTPAIATAIARALTHRTCTGMVERLSLISDVIKVLDSADSSVVITTIDLVSSLRGEAFIPHLWRFSTHAETAIRNCALDHLSLKMSAVSLPYVIRDFPHFETTRRMQFLDVLAGIHDSSALTVLKNALGDPVWEVGIRARDRALEWAVDHREDVDPAWFINHLQNGTPFGQAHAAHICGRLGWRESCRALLDLLDSPDLDVVRESIIALGRLRETSAGTRVAHILNVGDPELRSSCLVTLGLIDDRLQAAELQKWSSDDDPGLACFALAALEYMTANGLEPDIYRNALKDAEIRHGIGIANRNREWFDDELSLSIPKIAKPSK